MEDTKNSPKILNVVSGIDKEQKNSAEGITPEDSALLDGRHDDWRIDISQNYPEPEFTLTYNGIGLMPLGDLSMVKAKAKNGKTFLFTVLMASLLGCEDFGFKSITKNPKVLYFDTEQSKNDTAKVIKRDYRLLGWLTDREHEGLLAFNCREVVSKTDMLEGIKQRVRLYKPTHVFIDGIVDLCENFNDVEKAQPLVREIMRLSSLCHCHVCVVLHTNKAKDDDNARGHLGTELTNKCADILQVTKNGDVIDVKETECRGHKMIDDFAFSIGPDGMPFTTESTAAVKEKEKVNEIRTIMQSIFKDDPFLGTGELSERYVDYCHEHGKELTAQTVRKFRIKTALENGILGTTPSGKYTLCKDG